MPSNGFRRGKRLIAATVAIAATGGTAALAFTGATGAGGPPTSAAPDLVSATITRAPAITSPLGAQVRYCFDENLNPASIDPTSFRTSTYDTDQRIASTNATIDVNDSKCVIVTFAAGNDIEEHTVAYLGPAGSVADTSGAVSPQESAPITGSKVAAVAGATTAPDLVGAEINAGANPPQITYTFDETLDPDLSGGGANLAAKFGFYVDTDDGACATAPCSASFGRRGTAVAGVDDNKIVISFGAPVTNVQQAKLFFVDPGLGTTGANERPADQVTNNTGPTTNTISPIGHVGQPITGGPTIVSAAKQADNQRVNLTFAQNVVPGAVGAAAPGGNVVAYRADARTIGGTYVIGTQGSDLKTLPVTMPATTQNDPRSVVRIGIRPGLVRNQANDRSNAFGAAAISTEPFQAGFSDGPDLLRTTINDATNTVTYEFDEPVRSNPSPSGTEFQVINADGTVSPGQAGSAVVSGDRLKVDVKFTGSVSGSSIAGVSNNLFATQDAVDDNPAGGNDSLPGSVSTTLISCVETGTCPTTTPTPTSTVTVTPTPTATQPPGQTINVKTTVSLARKAGGRKFTGKVRAKGPCRSGRSVRLFKGAKRLKTVPSRGNGSFTFNFKKRVKGKVRAKVTKRITKSGNITYNCSVAFSKKA